MYTGITGSLNVKNALGLEIPIAYISGWSIEDKTEMIEASKFTSINKESLPGFRSWSASANGAVSFTGLVSPSYESGSDALFNAQFSGTELDFYFYLDVGEREGGKETASYFCGKGYIESLSIDLSAEDAGRISISVAGTGPLKLYCKGVDIMTGSDYVAERTLTLSIGGNGHLRANVPDGFSDAVRLEDGRLSVRLI